MKTLADFQLKENPFRIGPPLDPSEIVWAGFKNLKGEIETRIKHSIVTSPSRMVLNWGRYGSGKTHAANYYTRTDAVGRLCTELQRPKVKSIKINLPRTSKDPVQAFLRSFLGQIGLSQMKSDLHEIRQAVGNEMFSEILNSVSSDSVIAELINNIIAAENAEQLTPLESYLFGDSTKGTLAKVGLPAGLKDDEQVVNLLSTYINTVIFRKIVYSSFVIWLDEFEDIDTLNKTSQDRFTTFLRQLFDKTPNSLLLFLNFTPKTFFNIEDLSVMLGEALSTRAKVKIEFYEPSIVDATEYLADLLGCTLFRQDHVPKSLIPFTDESVQYVLTHIGRLSIRKINEVFSLILELSMLNDYQTIDKEAIDKLRDEILYWQ